jgi:hypothetical protein
MANVAVTGFFRDFTPTTWSVIGLCVTIVVALVRVWPLVMAKVNEARKIGLDADAHLRGDLLDRIKMLEEGRDGDQQRLSQSLADERRRCDGELADMRRDFEKRVDELMRIITQNSQSTAQLLGNPEALTMSKTRKEPK